ncbi:GYD domain-containing protein [bacterium]|nr:GYD domain-containing protein [bacterium]
MATYFLTGTYTAEAIKGISSKRTADITEMIENIGGKVVSMYLLLGEKDLVIIAEFPGLKEAIKGSVSISKMTGISFSTNPAITAKEFDEFMA